MAIESSEIEAAYVPLRDSKWDLEPGNKTPAYEVPETDTQITISPSESFSDSQNVTASSLSKPSKGTQKHARDEDDDATAIFPPKRPTRACKSRFART